MDADRFAAILRSFAARATRRASLRFLTAGALLDLIGADESAAKSGTCKQACGECQQCKKGKCKQTRHGKRCKSGKCLPQPDGAACGQGGVCQSGACICPSGTEVCGGACLAPCAANEARNPATCGCCLISNVSCTAAPSACCSGNCADFMVLNLCLGRPNGQPCTFAAQCTSNICSGGLCSS